VFDLDFCNANFLAGCDEVGRGPLAGPVVGTCVFIDKVYVTEENLKMLIDLGVTDSKKLSAKKRIKILKELGIDFNLINQKVDMVINQNFKISFSTRVISNETIDEINILRASLKAMGDAFIDCHATGETGKVLIDGNKLLELNLSEVEEEFVIKGDSKSALIGLASIIAKEYRDQLMEKYGVTYPGYGLEKHAGYPTKAHKEAIVNLGVTPIHRKSFKGVKEFCQNP
jgi:ribonuclease HII